MRNVVAIVVLVAIVIAIPLVRQYKAAHAPVEVTRDVDEGTPADRIAKRLANAQDTDFLERTLPDGTRVGRFGTTFAVRSPLSAPAAMAKRLHLAATPPDYDPATVPFLVAVPETYDKRKPMGLIVLCNYKASNQLPTDVLPQLAAANVAFAVAKTFPDEWSQRAGAALDAVHNLRARYAIDPNRIYVFGSNDPDGPAATATKPALTGLRLGLNYPDVFAGTFSLGLGSYRSVRAANGGYYSPTIPAIAPDLLSLARRRPLVLASEQLQDYHRRVAASYEADQFDHVSLRVVTIEQFHYPRYTADWIPDVLKFMDAAGTAEGARRRSDTARAVTLADDASAREDRTVPTGLGR